MDASLTKSIGHYAIAQTLGRGASCKVKLAYDTRDNNKPVAIKIMDEKVMEADKELLFNEIEIMSALEHKHIIKYL